MLFINTWDYVPKYIYIYNLKFSRGICACVRLHPCEIKSKTHYNKIKGW